MLRALDRLRHERQTLLRGRRGGDGFGCFELRGLSRFTRLLLCSDNGGLGGDAFCFASSRVDRAPFCLAGQAIGARSDVTSLSCAGLCVLTGLIRFGDPLLARVLLCDHLPLRAIRTWLRARLFDAERARDLVQSLFALRSSGQGFFAGQDDCAVTPALVQPGLQRLDELSSRRWRVGGCLRQEDARSGGKSQWSHGFAFFVEPAVVMDLSKMTTETVSLIFSLPML